MSGSSRKRFVVTRGFVLRLLCALALALAAASLVYSALRSKTPAEAESVDNSEAPTEDAVLGEPRETQPETPNDNMADPSIASSGVDTKNTPASKSKTFTYAITVDGEVKSDFAEFREQVAQTLNDSRGWNRVDIYFTEVKNKPNFTIYLSAPGRVGAYPGCSTTLSCRYGNRVMINDERWQLATTAWNGAGATLRDYRHLIVNHEVGHWLDHRHITKPCTDTTQLAPVMIESSIRPTCAPNPWPLDDELWTKR